MFAQPLTTSAQPSTKDLKSWRDALAYRQLTRRLLGTDTAVPISTWLDLLHARALHRVGGIMGHW